MIVSFCIGGAGYYLIILLFEIKLCTCDRIYTCSFKSTFEINKKVMSKKVIEIVTAKGSKGFVSYETVNADSYFGVGGSGQSDGAIKGEKALSHSFLMDTLRKVMGRTLTVIDASVHEKTQNKAIKDIIRTIFSDEIEFSSQMAFDQNILTEMANKHFEGVSDEDLDRHSVTTEEALGVI